MPNRQCLGLQVKKPKRHALTWGNPKQQQMQGLSKVPGRSNFKRQQQWLLNNMACS
jgi:hypothetical protein